VSPSQIAELAFRLHKEGHITREELVYVVGQCINAAALENGYADEHGLPFPEEEHA
jgi:hypothetical protein